MEKIPVVAVVGPTASGKTKVGVEIAKKFGGEVISADSMQIYKGMQILTAKPTDEEMQGVPHYMIDFLDLDKNFSVGDYVEMARPILYDIHKRGKLPVVVGGTGLYVDSLLNNVTFEDTGKNEELRKQLNDLAEEKGNEYLYSMLNELDAEAAEKIHPNNRVRLVRALEVIKSTGQTFTEQKKKNIEKKSPYDVCFIGLNFLDRNILYDRINRRCDKMVSDGVIEEVRNVYKMEKLVTASAAIGLKEWKPYFDGFSTIDECIEKIKAETRHYAKRQLTWFRRNKQIKWVYVDKGIDTATIFSIVKKNVEKSV